MIAAAVYDAIDAARAAHAPLPLASHWNPNSWTPSYWVEALEQGHHVLPAIWGPESINGNNLSWIDQYGTALRIGAEAMMIL